MHSLLFKFFNRSVSASLFLQRTAPTTFVHQRTVQRMFSSMSMNDVVNSFYARGEAEELTITTLSKTMHDIMNNTRLSMNEYEQYQPIAEELAHYVVKLMSQHKKPFVSQQ